MPGRSPFKRFLWSHDLAVHRWAVRLYNAVMRIVPFSWKYSIGKRLRSRISPYRLVRPGSVIVQVGAPRDTLASGRSRGMYFSLLAGENGRVVIVEPDDQSIAEFRTIARRQGVDNVTFFDCAAWSAPDTLKIWVNDAHPASNFTDGTKDYGPERMRDYRLVELPADSLDNLLQKANVGSVDIVSITTNGAEREILEGLRQTMAAGLPYICLAVTGEGYEAMMREFGYELFAHDDRGFTFQQVSS